MFHKLPFHIYDYSPQINPSLSQQCLNVTAIDNSRSALAGGKEKMAQLHWESFKAETTYCLSFTFHIQNVLCEYRNCMSNIMWNC